MTTYKVTMQSGDEWYMAADFTQASSALRACFNDPKQEREWRGMPYQVADAKHTPSTAATLIHDYARLGSTDEIESVTSLEQSTNDGTAAGILMLMAEQGITLEELIDAYIEHDAIIGVGLITLRDQVTAIVDAHLK